MYRVIVDIMTTLETVIFILGWSTMIAIFDYLESDSR